MDLSDLIELTGTDQFDRACQLAWDPALTRCWGRPWHPGGARYERPTDVGEIHASLMDTLLYDGGKEIAQSLVRERLAVATELYQRMPGYGVLAMAEPFMCQDAVADCTTRTLRAALEQPADQLAEPVAYWLLVDAFEFDPSPGGTG